MCLKCPDLYGCLLYCAVFRIRIFFLPSQDTEPYNYFIGSGSLHEISSSGPRITFWSIYFSQKTIFAALGIFPSRITLPLPLPRGGGDFFLVTKMVFLLLHPCALESLMDCQKWKSEEKRYRLIFLKLCHRDMGWYGSLFEFNSCKFSSMNTVVRFFLGMLSRNILDKFYTFQHCSGVRL